MKFSRPIGVTTVPTPANRTKLKNLVLKRSIRPVKSLEGNKSLKRSNVVASIKRVQSN